MPLPKIISPPYSKKFTVKDGAEFTIKGISLREPKENKPRFSINLSSQTKLEPTTSLHLEVRLDENKVVLNSVEGGDWGEPQVMKNPFVLGGDYEVKVKCTTESFMITLGNEIDEFNFRGNPAVAVKYIYIEGQANISSLESGD